MNSRPAAKPPVVWITGAAGGLGNALVSEFLAQGWNVAAAWHRQPPRWKPCDRLWTFPLDVTQKAQVRNAASEIVERWRRIDLLVNNAGITVDQPVWQLDAAEWDRVIDVHLKGAFLCAQAALGSMFENRDGHIINVASFAGRIGSRGQSNYAAAKAGLIGLTESLAKEAGSFNVRVNAILPGVMQTPMTASLSTEQWKDFAAANALGRINDLCEVARFIAFLATTRNISGQIFQLDSRIARW
ncbi:MAG: SDR family NAD(P)-dependent oxidoreductase, partial [Verrucomicrobiota bacterium]